MRCPICGTEIQGRPPNCPRCGTRLWYDEQGSAAPQGPWQGSQTFQQPQYPGYGPAYPQEEQAPQPGYPPGYPQQTPPSAPYGAYGAYAPPSMPAGSAPGYWAPFPPGYGPGPGQPYSPYGVGAPATTPFAPAAAPRKRGANPFVIVLSIIAAVVVIAAAGVGAIYFAQHSGGTTPVGTTPIGTATTGPTNTPSPTVIYQNAMTTADPSWAQDQHCFFRSDGYHIVNGEICFAPINDIVNVDITVDMIAISGDLGAPHGITFRHDQSHEYYFFGVDPIGHWAFFKCLAGQSTCVRVVDFRSDGAIRSGLHVVNRMEVVALGSHYTFNVNGAQVGTADDTSLLAMGSVGLAGQDNSEVVYSNLKITLPLQ